MDRVVEAAERWKEANRIVAERRQELREAVGEARAGGATLHELSQILGVSRERVRQMTGDPDDRISFDSVLEVRCDRCGARPTHECESAKGRFHLERHHRRGGVQSGEITELDADELHAMAATLS